MGVSAGQARHQHHANAPNSTSLRKWRTADLAHGQLIMRQIWVVLGLLGAAHGSSCPLSFQRIGRGCYFYGYFKLNWFRAMEFCHSFGRGASLATLDTPGENRKIKTWLLEHGEISGTPHICRNLPHV